MTSRNVRTRTLTVENLAPSIKGFMSQAAHSNRYARAAFVIARCVAAGFALYATAKHPYNFYVLTRWVVFLACCFGLWLNRNRLWPSFASAYGVVGLVFNPLLPFHFTRSTWHVLDITAGTVFLASLLFDRPPPE